MEVTDSTEILKRLDALSANINGVREEIHEMRLESRVFQAQTTERLEAINQRLDSMEKRQDATDQRIITQENRVWGLIVAATVAVFGLLSKLAFFPTKF
ncbi:hypothetical protein DO97_20850 [Neosynechococcus sphagnicola sy1]|uniref:Uncharacterized protein n=1 Tax=Neosynechococcus sphagnicola sy1 TaxID=1497020 RepID=A0A098TLZ7_9CYAN|nr:hypothetical protein [Neosynechococcus sphagnicola]KGF73286.1 hypothetical protein DO97_20850 [Neosynechococcus sphagnicola sy1]